MERVYVAANEWYPVYSLADSEQTGYATDIPEEDAEFVRKAFVDFERAQRILRNAEVTA
jgi:hypothetical protein